MNFASDLPLPHILSLTQVAGKGKKARIEALARNIAFFAVYLDGADP
jgi:hypothetical protein